MHRLILCALLALAACGRPTDDRTTYRDAGLNLYSNAVFDPARMQGDWRQAAAFTRNPSGACQGGGASFADYDPTGNRIRVTMQLCLSGKPVAFAGPADFMAPGRLRLSGADPQGIGQPWWVIWVDTDYRTMVIGTPSGDFGFILNRGSVLSADRLTAAREILDWNGYDLSQLHLMR